MANTVNRTSSVEHVGQSGVYPVSGPWPSGDANIVGQGELGHPDEHRRLQAERRKELSQTAVLSLGRAIFGGFFIYNGMNHFLNRKMMTDYARSKNVPSPDVAVMGTGLLLVLGGASLIAGVRPKVGAGLVTLFLAGVSPMMHNFWAVDDEEQRTHELINFTKNIALMGGAAFAAAVPEPWPLRPAIGMHAAPTASRT
jgi:uncharacterized membrane protein YphA (DoxX/SURF4 family)